MNIFLIFITFYAINHVTEMLSKQKTILSTKTHFSSII